MFAYVFRDVEVESGIVDQYQHVGLPFHDVPLTGRHVLQDGVQVQQYRYETHISHLFVVLHQRASNTFHQVTTIETEFSLAVLQQQRLHQV